MQPNDLSPRTLCKIVDGKIIPPMNLELIVADHCNIACRQCNHASPIMKKWNATCDEVAQTLGLLSGVYHARRLRLIGGEPMLNPQLLDIIGAAKRSGVADIIQMTTNGMLLDRLPDAGWDALDEIELSVYGISGLTNEKLEGLRHKGEQHGTLVNIASYPNFRMTFTARKATDPALVNDVWRACKMAQVWGCHALRGDRLYRCPQSIYVPGFTGGQLSEEGFALVDTPELRDNLLRFLNGPGPLKSCAHCVGSCGKQFEQTGLARTSWRADLDVPYEDMIDFDLLERSKTQKQVIDDCRTPITPSRRKRGVLQKLQSLWPQ